MFKCISIVFEQLQNEFKNKIRYSVNYHVSSRHALEKYFVEVAPRMRQIMLTKFPQQGAISVNRKIMCLDQTYNNTY